MKLELFPCSGGMAEGFRRAGVYFTQAFDKDPNACASYERNLGHRPVQMDARDLLRMVQRGWLPGHVQLLVADPPCTPWSRAGKRLGVEDERDMLGVTCELVRLLRPDAYLIGNVPGLDDSTQWHHVQSALAPLRRAGYCIADYASLDAADFGVPQHRVRPFWFGHLAGPCIRWPLPTHGPPEHPSLPGLELKPWVSCRQALRHLPLKDLGRPVRLRYRGSQATTEEQRKKAGKKPRASRVNEPAETIRAKPDNPLDLRDRHPTSSADAPARTLRADGGRAGRRESVITVPPNHAPSEPDWPSHTIVGKRCQVGGQVLSVPERAFNPNLPDDPVDKPSRSITTQAGDTHLLEWPWDRPSTTVCAGIDKIAPAGEHAGQFGPNAIVLSERAAAILQGFPEGWHFAGATKTARWSQLGQAMPPALAHAVAQAVVEQLAATNPKPEVASR